MRENFLKRNYKAVWKFSKEARWYFVTVFGIFMLIFLMGFMFPVFFRDQIFLMMEELSKSIEGLSVGGLISFIFANNLKVSFMAMIGGLFIGIVPAIFLIVNGYVIGFVSREVAEVSSIWSLTSLLPHGIFEIPAIIFSIGLGMKIGFGIFRKGRGKILKRNLKESLRFFVFVVFPLLVIAAIIEGILIAIF